MQTQDIMTFPVETITSKESIKDAAVKMRNMHVGTLLVVDEGKLVGVITDRDICCKVIATNRDAVMTEINEIMTKDTFAGFDDEDINDAAKMMKDHHIRRLPIIHHDKSLAGLLSIDDLARTSHELAGSVLEAALPSH
jgi:CBS domain-containing protein